ncbi:ATP-binding protein [uncultured Brevundimonas sp.]|uniref:ATP-binding protein n=1 Tax=uncultured Brevundimonas sp. TaxID=213418 RepID=UPI0025DADFAA|nr:ATP-binding protein [uncultured Brevundimonas sp.]
MTKTDFENTSDRLLTEVERQQKYLDRLPDDYAYPLFNAAQALESQRRSGYRNTASAAREIVDNAMEAGAKRIDICFERPKQLKAHQRADSIHAMAFIDNGSGMIPRMAQYALSWGSSTHFDDPAFIGKFGFGLPNASINQTKLVEVYTKVAGATAITKAVLDARAVKAHGLQTIGEPTEAELPEFVQSYLDRQSLAFDHGTIVVWVEPDRISYRRPALMKEHLVDDFGVTYRYLLDRVDLFVDGTKVEPVDPLFLTPGARYYLDQDKGGAEMSADWNLAVKYARDENGVLGLTKVTDIADIDPEDPDLEAAGTIYVKVGRFPYGFAEAAAGKTDASKRFEIRKTRRGMSFVRAGREIETVDVFPKSMRDLSKGLGSWPLLQSYAYHWGVEVSFDPRLDEVFGITNDKQTVRPIEDLWRLFAAEKIDAQLGREQTHQRKMRKAEEDKRKAKEAKKQEKATLAETAAAKADSITGQPPRVAEKDKAKVREDLEAAATQRAKVDESSIEDARKAIEDEARRRKYVIDFYDEARGPFYKPEWAHGEQIAVLINREHPFFQSLYAPLLKSSDSGPAKDALDVLLIALARAELSIDDETCAAWYVAQRERAWSPFLADAYNMLQQATAPVDEETAEASAAEDDQDEAAEAA